MKQFLMCLALLTGTPLVLAEYLPRDVQRFVDRRGGCDQLRRMKDVERDMLKPCIGTDKELAQLKRKYAANSTIMQILTQFESGIEVAEAAAPKRK